jgi:hypothetical protein
MSRKTWLVDVWKAHSQNIASAHAGDWSLYRRGTKVVDKYSFAVGVYPVTFFDQQIAGHIVLAIKDSSWNTVYEMNGFATSDGQPNLAAFVDNGSDSIQGWIFNGPSHISEGAVWLPPLSTGTYEEAHNLVGLVYTLAKEVNGRDIDYVITTTNSNRFAKTALDLLGFEVPAEQLSMFGVGVPGYERSLLTTGELADVYTEWSDHWDGDIHWNSMMGNGLQAAHCFPRGTAILLADGQTGAIDALAIGDEVLAYDSVGTLHPKKVSRLFENITDSWIRLSNGLTVTPGHHFLDAFGRFRTIEEILASDARIVLKDGSLVRVSGEFVHYSEATADQFEQAEGYVTPSVGALALAPVYKKGWKTYNFEVEDYHTYIAGGVRVHNASVFTATGKDLTVGAKYESPSGELLEVLGDGSIYNHNTGYTSPSGGDFSKVKLRYAPANMTPTEQAAAVEARAFSSWQETGSGPSVRLASGKVVAAGTVFATGDGYRFGRSELVAGPDTLPLPDLHSAPHRSPRRIHHMASSARSGHRSRSRRNVHGRLRVQP